MRPFVLARTDNAKHAIAAHRYCRRQANDAVNARSQYLAGGTTLIDLMKLDVMRPELVIDINALEQTPSGRIEFGPQGLAARRAGAHVGGRRPSRRSQELSR